VSALSAGVARPARAGFVADPAWVLALATLALHLWANRGYGIFRDELYYIACGEHLAWGYVDHPPLVPWIARLSRAVLGESLLGLRVVPALAAAATVALTVTTTRYLGGGRYAAWLAGLAVMAAGLFQALGLLLCTDTLSPLLWLAIAYALIRAQRDAAPGWWLAAGMLAGMALLNKYTVVFYLAAVAPALLVTPQRRVLATAAPWLGALIALALAAPNLIWQHVHGWPFLEFAAHVAARKNVALAPHQYLLGQIRMLNPVTFPVWGAGLVALAAWRRFADLRWIALAWALVIGAMIALHGKTYYPGGSYPVLFAAGAVALEAWMSAGWRARALRPALAGLVVLGGVAFAPFSLPVLPVDDFIAYQRWLGEKPRKTEENNPVGALSEYYADMFGWRAMVDAVERAYAALPAAERARTVFYGPNYGEAAAVEVLGRAGAVPPVISGHNSYFLWGPGDGDRTLVLVFERERAVIAPYCDGLDPVGWFDDAYAMPFERQKTLWLCTLNQPVSRLWAKAKHFD